jgi:hypothetical protein
MDDYASLVLDRNSASQESDVHLLITDNQLNIDPTAEDIVSFYVASGDEGVSWMNRTTTWGATDYIAFDNSFDDNGKLIINNATNGGLSVLTNIVTADDTTADNFMVFYEGGENSGIFYNTDDADNASLEVADGAQRGFTATFDYNDSAQSFLIANDFGVITMDASSVGDVWNSGEALTVTLIDQDLNKNSASSEDLYLTNTTNGHLIPSLQIGSPLMVLSTATDVAGVSSYSNIAYYTNTTVGQTTGNTANFTLHTGYTGAQIGAIDTVNTYWNFDFSAFTNATNPVVGACLNTGSIEIACTAGEKKGIEEIDSPSSLAGAVHVELMMTQNVGNTVTTQFVAIPYVSDVFSFGDDGTNNAIYRLELAESGGDTGVFEGSV